VDQDTDNPIHLLHFSNHSTTSGTSQQPAGPNIATTKTTSAPANIQRLVRSDHLQLAPRSSGFSQRQSHRGLDISPSECPSASSQMLRIGPCRKVRRLRRYRRHKSAHRVSGEVVRHLASRGGPCRNLQLQVTPENPRLSIPVSCCRNLSILGINSRLLWTCAWINMVCSDRESQL